MQTISNIENSWNRFLRIYVCYILKQEPYQYLYFLSRYGGKYYPFKIQFLIFYKKSKTNIEIPEIAF